MISFRVLESLTAPRERSASPRAGGRVASGIEMTVTVTLPDGKALELQDGATGADAAAAIGPGLARAALAIEVGGTPGSSSRPDPASKDGFTRVMGPRRGVSDLKRQGELRDLSRALPNGARIAIVTAKDAEQALALIRHDAAHVLAAAVMELWPGVKISIGPAIADGFYYDFEFPAGTAISDADFPAIESEDESST